MKPSRFGELIEKGVNSSFAKIITNPTTYHADLDILIQEVNSDYAVNDQSSLCFNSQQVENILPLWSDNGDYYVRWQRQADMEYVLLLHDDREWSKVASSEQGMMGVLWQSWCEFRDDESELEKFALAIGFEYWEESKRRMDYDYREFEEWLLNFKGSKPQTGSM